MYCYVKYVLKLICYLLLTLNDGEKMNNTNKLEQHKEFLLQKRHSILAQLPKELLEQLVQIEHSLLH